MTANETAKVMAILQVAYPAFYGKKSVEEKRAAVSLWAELLKEYDSRLVTAAVKELIKTHSGYPPDIAAVVERIHGIEDAARGEQTNEELWILLKKAISNGYYGAEEEFQRLPEVLKRYLRSPSQLREMSGIDSDTLNTVTRGQFLKTIGIERQRQRDREIAQKSLPPQLYNALAGVADSMALPDTAWQGENLQGKDYDFDEVRRIAAEKLKEGS